MGSTVGGVFGNRSREICFVQPEQNSCRFFGGQKSYFHEIFMLFKVIYAIILQGVKTLPGKGAAMNNILFFLTPKAMCSFVYDDFTIRQALEKMESGSYTALPILNKRGEYRGTLTEGDLLWALKNMCYMDMRQAESRKIMEIERKRNHIPVRVTADMHDLVQRASTQNFVPVVDDKDAFIGIITRGAIIKYCQQMLLSED